MSAAARPLVAVQKTSGDASQNQVKIPAVFLAPIRQDIVSFAHTRMNKNKRQAYAVSPGAGHQHSAESWGTGRAVSRIPRVSGGGTSRAGQAAFGNMCRKGRMFAPTHTWRKWHQRIATNQKRFAVASALAASALPSLVMARGHIISEVAELPCVVDNSVESLQRTKQAIAALTALGAYADVEKARDSKKIRRGRGKMRNRRHVMRKGPLIVYREDNGIVQSFRNLPGVELQHVDRLNLLQLAPGGHLGRFIIWTQAAFERLDAVWGSVKRQSEQKKGYTLPRNIISNTDIARVINSEEIQSKLRPAVTQTLRKRRKKNPLKNFGVKVKLNPYALALRRAELNSQAKAKEARHAKVKAARSAQVKKAAKSHGKNKASNYARISRVE